VVDLETNEAKLIDLRRSDVARRASQRRDLLQRRFRGAAIDSLTISTAMPYDRELLRFFRERAARHSGRRS
jgi:hypothetical protein